MVLRARCTAARWDLVGIKFRVRILPNEISRFEPLNHRGAVWSSGFSRFGAPRASVAEPAEAGTPNGGRFMGRLPSLSIMIQVPLRLKFYPHPPIPSYDNLRSACRIALGQRLERGDYACGPRCRCIEEGAGCHPPARGSDGRDVGTIRPQSGATAARRLRLSRIQAKGARPVPGRSRGKRLSAQELGKSSSFTVLCAL